MLLLLLKCVSLARIETNPTLSLVQKGKYNLWPYSLKAIKISALSLEDKIYTLTVFLYPVNS